MTEEIHSVVAAEAAVMVVVSEGAVVVLEK
jgi:hypothetical protein